MSWHRLILTILIVVHFGNAQWSTDGQFFIGIRLQPPPPPPNDTRLLGNHVVEMAYFTQLLDHFNTSVNSTWKQRYLVNKHEYKPGGPIFVMIGGESAIDEYSLTYGQMYQNAKTHGALMFKLEHRFYGESHPTSDVSISNLRYLNSVQALADLDAFIMGMKQLYEIPNAKVVVFGCSYAGNLAVWYRLLYPNSSVGAVASSAPVLAKANMIEYMETVGNGLKYYDPDCYTAVNDAFKAVQDLISAKNDKKLNSLFGICGTEKINFSDSYEIQTFYFMLLDMWRWAAQTNDVGNSSTVARICQTMTNASYGEPVDRMSNIYKSSNRTCIDPDYKSLLTKLKNDSWYSPGIRRWLWQTCTEFGYYLSTDSRNQPFGFGTVTIEFMQDSICNQIFDITSEDIAANVAATNKRYGGKTPNVTNVFFLNGSIDPWHKLSIFEDDLNESCPSRFIEGTSHCYDMKEAQETDPPGLTKARLEVAITLSSWLAD